MKVLIVTNIPVPYRIPIYNILETFTEMELVVAYMAPTEENRKWALPDFKHKHFFLPIRKTFAKKDGFNYVHINKGVWQAMNKNNPDVVITTGFNPAHIIAWLWTRINGKKHIGWADGWLQSEESLTVVHRLTRRIIYKYTNAFIGASKETFKLFSHYGARKERMFQSALVVDNELFAKSKLPFEKREYDLIFSGTLSNHKNPFFIIEVLKLLKLKRPNVSIVFLGKGPLKDKITLQLDKINVEYKFAGHVSQNEIPKYMGNAKIHVFPTIQEAWGIVVNEAAAAGTPSITSKFTAVVNELVLNDKTGWALDLEPSMWANKIDSMLINQNHWQQLSDNMYELIQDYSFSAAAKGTLEACKKAME